MVGVALIVGALLLVRGCGERYAAIAPVLSDELVRECKIYEYKDGWRETWVVRSLTDGRDGFIIRLATTPELSAAYRQRKPEDRGVPAFQAIDPKFTFCRYVAGAARFEPTTEAEWAAQNGPIVAGPEEGPQLIWPVFDAQGKETTRLRNPGDQAIIDRWKWPPGSRRMVGGVNENSGVYYFDGQPLFGAVGVL